MLRAQLTVSLGGTSTDVSAPAMERLRANASQLAAGDVLRMLTALSDLEPRFRKSGQQQLLIELLLVRFALLDRTLSLEDVLRGLSEGGSGSNGGGGDRAPSSGDRGGSRGGGAGGSSAPPANWRAALEEGLNAASPAASAPAKRPAPAPSSNAAPSNVAPEPRETGAPPRASASRNARGQTPVQDSALSTMRSAMEAMSRGDMPARLSDEEIRVERANTLRAKDPVLGAAIDALDLELLD
jgi:DNA polymerase-3 subunit gamma/tau